MQIFFFRSPASIGRDAGKIEDDIASPNTGLGLATLKDPTRSGEKKNEKIRQLDGSERIGNMVRIIIDDSLGFGENDIPEDFSFGNGVTRGGIMLKDGRIVSCAWVCFDDGIVVDAVKLKSIVTK